MDHTNEASSLVQEDPNNSFSYQGYQNYWGDIDDEDFETDSNSWEADFRSDQSHSGQSHFNERRFATGQSGSEYVWRDLAGQLVGPYSDEQNAPIQRAILSLSEDDQLGLMIRGGAEFGLGIFVTGVLHNSAACKLGLKPGDQLLSVNGHSFHEIQHRVAVNILAQSHSHNQAKLTVTYKRMGMIPYSPVPVNQERNEVKSPEVPYAPPIANGTHFNFKYQVRERSNTAHSFSGSGSVSDHRETVSPALEEIMMVKEKATAMLDQTHLSLLMFYLEQYRARNMSVHNLVTSLQNMFDTQEKEGLFTEIDELIYNDDINVFNKIVFQSDQTFERFLSNENHSEYSSITKDFYLDSRLESSKGDTVNSYENYEYHQHHHTKGLMNSYGFKCLQVDSDPSDTENLLQYHEKKQCLSGISKDKSDNLPTMQPVTNLKNELGSFRLNKVLQIKDQLGTQRHSSSTTHSGASKVEILKKSKTLGMVIEGGRDTDQKEPRIINIQPGGQAFETAGLRVGQIIKQVDGINLKGLQHKEIAKLLWNQYTRKESVRTYK